MIEQLHEAVESELELYTTNHSVFVDYEGLEGGDLYQPSLAKALCESACMILVYTPSYFDEKNTFCAREYRAMEMIEAKRLSLLKQPSKDHGLIIPVVFRGRDQLPEFVSKYRHYYDFQSFLLSSSRISEHPDFSTQVAKLAKYIYNRLKDFSSLPEDVCKDCDSFCLPPDQEVANWIKSFDRKNIGFPGL